MLKLSIIAFPLAAFVIALCVVPIVRHIGLACGFVDNPDRWRKLHSVPIALGGGIGVWVATWSAWAVSLLFAERPPLAGDAGWFCVALMPSTLLILVVGMIDDRIGLRGRQKLAGQLAAAVMLVALGLRIDALTCCGVELKLGVFAPAVTVFWIVLVVNAFNFVDGMDGFCGSLGLIAALAIAWIGYKAGLVQDTLIALSLAGALAGFLRYNLPPAKIYLGDAGSMVLGVMISVLSVRACSDGLRTAVPVLPVFALAMLPLLDIVTAVGRRWVKGGSIFIPDSEHIHHCLRKRVGRTGFALGAGVLLGILGAGGAACATVYRMGDAVAGLAIGLSVGLLVCTNAFGASELRLLVCRIKAALKRDSTKDLPVHQRPLRPDFHLQGNRK